MFTHGKERDVGRLPFGGGGGEKIYLVNSRPRAEGL